MDTTNNTYADWYQLWLAQSRSFFETATQQMAPIFNNESTPRDKKREQIEEWVALLKQQWQQMQMPKDQQAYLVYWQWMSSLCQQAMDALIEAWMQRIDNHKPVNNTHELYELWLSCCHDVYQKAMRTPAYQKAYGDFMNAALNCWQTAAPK